MSTFLYSPWLTVLNPLTQGAPGGLSECKPIDQSYAFPSIQCVNSIPELYTENSV